MLTIEKNKNAQKSNKSSFKQFLDKKIFQVC